MSHQIGDMEVIYEMPGHLIRRAQQISTALFTEECAKYDLTSVQYAALHTINLHPGIDATRLSALIAFDRSTIGDVLDRMDQKRLDQSASPAMSDRRIKMIDLSDGWPRHYFAGLSQSVRLRAATYSRTALAPADRDRFVMGCSGNYRGLFTMTVTPAPLRTWRRRLEEDTESCVRTI